MQKLFTAAAVCLLCHGVRAQSVTPEVVATSGGYFTSTNAQLSWTLGEPVVDTWSGVSGTLTQGFQQPVYTISGTEELPRNVLVTVYPNPSAGLINISINGTHDYTQALLTNASGQTVAQIGLSGPGQNSFDLSGFASGTYVLSLIDSQQQKQSITIIKQ